MSIVILFRYLDLEQRLCLFEARVDNCLCEPFFASEMVVCLGMSIRPRQAASELGASSTTNVLRSVDLEASCPAKSGTAGKGDRSPS
jgi:hypothetical protein